MAIMVNFAKVNRLLLEYLEKLSNIYTGYTPIIQQAAALLQAAVSLDPKKPAVSVITYLGPHIAHINNKNEQELFNAWEQMPGLNIVPIRSLWAHTAAELKELHWTYIQGIFKLSFDAMTHSSSTDAIIEVLLQDKDEEVRKFVMDMVPHIKERASMRTDNPQQAGLLLIQEMMQEAQRRGISQDRLKL